MDEQMERQFSNLQIDALREITSIGTAHAATALSRLVDRKINITVSQLNLVPILSVPRMLYADDLPVTGVYFRITGDIGGSMLLFLPQEATKLLLKYLTEGIVSSEDIDKSAIMEVGNILANSYLNAIAETLNMKILISVPHYSKDLLSAVIDCLLIEIAQYSDYVLLMETSLVSEDTALKGNLMIFPDNPSLDKMLGKMGLP